MILDFASHEINDWNEGILSFETAPISSTNRSTVKEEVVRLVSDKIVMPASRGKIARPRLIEHLDKSLQQTTAALIAGRAGSGKTTLASDFAQCCDRAVAWYTVEAADNDWNVFLNYLFAALNEHRVGWQEKDLAEFVAGFGIDAGVAAVTESIAAWLAVAATEKPLLIVLDDVHLVFDAEWFEEFFKSFVMSLSSEVQLLMLSRCQPSVPLWRMRSKKMLTVIDEDLLNFTKEEAAQLFEEYGLSVAHAEIAHGDSYGRAAKLDNLAQICQKINETD